MCALHSRVRESEERRRRPRRRAAAPRSPARRARCAAWRSGRIGRGVPRPVRSGSAHRRDTGAPARGAIAGGGRVLPAPVDDHALPWRRGGTTEEPSSATRPVRPAAGCSSRSLLVRVQRRQVGEVPPCRPAGRGERPLTRRRRSGRPVAAHPLDEVTPAQPVAAGEGFAGLAATDGRPLRCRGARDLGRGLLGRGVFAVWWSWWSVLSRTRAWNMRRERESQREGSRPTRLRTAGNSASDRAGTRIPLVRSCWEADEPVSTRTGGSANRRETGTGAPNEGAYTSAARTPYHGMRCRGGGAGPSRSRLLQHGRSRGLCPASVRAAFLFRTCPVRAAFLFRTCSHVFPHSACRGQSAGRAPASAAC
ncbi:hypothetical protein STENM223S_10137 [Streptomyces tendae]